MSISQYADVSRSLDTFSNRRALVAIAIALLAAGCDGGSDAAVRPSPTATATPTSSPTANASRVPSSLVPTPSASPQSSQRQTPTAEDERIVAAIVAFARHRDAPTFAALSLADEVGLELDDQIPLPRSAAALARAEGWVLDVGEFQGHTGPFSALDLLARDVATTISIGPHPRCSWPSTTTPAALSSFRRISVQPKNVDTCVQWWAVDLYVSPAGQIAVVALDLWSP